MATALDAVIASIKVMEEIECPRERSRRRRRNSDSTPRLAQAGAGNLHIGFGPDFVKARFHRGGFVALLLQL